jgi:hypothetical protein
LEIGKLQGYVANTEFPMEAERLDVVWRRLPESVPTYVFEVQIGGDLYHALGKLKHAHDIWNSRIFLAASANDIGRVNHLLSGTFHEIKTLLNFIDIEKVQSLHQSKQNIYEIEKELGLIPDLTPNHVPTSVRELSMFFIPQSDRRSVAEPGGLRLAAKTAGVI